jgi:hypothetical protein
MLGEAMATQETGKSPKPQALASLEGFARVMGK